MSSDSARSRPATSAVTPTYMSGSPRCTRSSTTLSPPAARNHARSVAPQLGFLGARLLRGALLGRGLFGSGRLARRRLLGRGRCGGGLLASRRRPRLARRGRLGRRGSALTAAPASIERAGPDEPVLARRRRAGAANRGSGSTGADSDGGGGSIATSPLLGRFQGARRGRAAAAPSRRSACAPPSPSTRKMCRSGRPWTPARRRRRSTPSIPSPPHGGDGDAGDGARPSTSVRCRREAGRRAFGGDQRLGDLIVVLFIEIEVDGCQRHRRRRGVPLGPPRPRRRRRRRRRGRRFARRSGGAGASVGSAVRAGAGAAARGRAAEPSSSLDAVARRAFRLAAWLASEPESDSPGQRDEAAAAAPEPAAPVAGRRAVRTDGRDPRPRGGWRSAVGRVR